LLAVAFAGRIRIKSRMKIGKRSKSKRKIMSRKMLSRLNLAPTPVLNPLLNPNLELSLSPAAPSPR
jgi:hypothetical protein